MGLKLHLEDVAGVDVSSFPLAEDFAIEYRDDSHGSKIRFLVDSLGVVLNFPWWEDPRAEISGWSPADIPIGSPESPYYDSDQGWQILIWQSGDLVGVAQGSSPWGEYEDWFSVPVALYRSEWARVIHYVSPPEGFLRAGEGVDWQAVSNRMHTGGYGGRGVAMEALELALGNDVWLEATRFALRTGPFNEPLNSVLRMVRPRVAGHECVRVWREGVGNERLEAVLLLGDVARAAHMRLFWSFSRDADERIQVAGASIVQALADRGEVSSIEHFVVAMETHANPGVRAVAANIRENA